MNSVVSMNTRRIAALAATLITVLAVIGLTGIPARAATVSQITLPVGYPAGVALDALGWGGTGSSASCTTGAATVNDEVGVWNTAAAGCASQWSIVIAAGQTLATVVQLEYAPDGNTSADLCVSTVTDVQGAFARLRPCATGLNPWQDFSEVAVASDIAGAVELRAEGAGVAGWTAYNLNDRAFGKDGAAVISYPPTSGENQLWSIGPAI